MNLQKREKSIFVVKNTTDKVVFMKFHILFYLLFTPKILMK